MLKVTATFCVLFFSLGCIAGLSTLLFSQDSFVLTTEEVVEQFFPQRLIDVSKDRFARGGPAPFKTSTFKVADLDGDGTTFIIAVYTNGWSAAIRVLRETNSTFSLVDEPSISGLSGIFPFIELVDVENDGYQEVFVSITSARGPTEDWLFKWSGTELQLISPTAPDNPGDSILSESSLMDLDGDEILDIVYTRRFTPSTGVELAVYESDGQKFKFSHSLKFLESFFRREGTPFVEKSDFVVGDPGNSFVLTVVNGKRDGKDRVSSAVIRLNGVLIVGPNDLNQEVGQLVREVSVLQDNVVEVELRGEPEGHVRITVGPPQD